MYSKDEYSKFAEGRISLFLRDRAGNETPVMTHSNVIAYSAADIMAGLLAGVDNSCPQHVGFVYGDTATPGASMASPDTLPTSTRRINDWETISGDVADAGGNIVICPLALRPAVALDSASNSAYFSSNMATFSAHTGSVAEYAFSTDGAVYAGTVDSLGAVYFYQAVLLNRQVSGNSITYSPFARVSLGTSPFTAKPAGKELAVYWDIIFK